MGLINEKLLGMTCITSFNPRLKLKKFVALVLLCLCAAKNMPYALAEDVPAPTPEPYTADEFPLWAHELRRFEILTFGSLPLVTMLSFWTYDINRSMKHPGDQRYYPWPVKKAGIAVPLTEKEQKKIFFTSVGISIGIALTDICIRAIIRSVKEKKMVRENLIQEPIRVEPMEPPASKDKVRAP